MRIVLVGANHRTANLELRERLAFSHQQIPEALASLREQFGSIEAAILSTCNRSELYLARPAHGQPQFAQIIQFLAQRGDAEAAREVVERGIAVARQVGDAHAESEMSGFLETL